MALTTCRNTWFWRKRWLSFFNYVDVTKLYHIMQM